MNTRKQLEEINSNIRILCRAMHDSRTPRTAKILVIVAVAYLLSPVDLIPDFIPVLGLLDEMILIPVLARFALRMIPEELRRELAQ